MSLTLEEMLVKHEGERLKPYLDSVGKTTIGVGRNLTDNGILPIESRFMLANDIAEVNKQIYLHLPWAASMTPDRLMVLQDMCFNLGIERLLGFHNTLQLMQAGDYEGAAKNMILSKWASQVGERAVELANIMRKGEQ